MKFNTLIIYMCLFVVSSTYGCDTNKDPKPNKKPIEFAMGADVSWVTQMEAEGVKFYNRNNKETECMSLLKEEGVNSIRLRVWVDPKDGWCNRTDLLVKAKRAAKLGMRIMVDFHYSDTWADPGKQTKPEAWKNLSFNDLKNAVAVHTFDVLNLLKVNGITPEWVQIGNETGAGMLWPDGQYDKMNQYVQLHGAAYESAKNVFPTIKTVVHLQNGHNNTLFVWFFDELKKYGAKWDVIGMSLYPTSSNWLEYIKNTIDNIDILAQRYQKEIIVCEFGMPANQSEIAYMAMDAIISEAIDRIKLCTGLFYWEPQAYGGWQGYLMGAFSDEGKPTAALEAFSNS